MNWQVCSHHTHAAGIVNMLLRAHPTAAILLVAKDWDRGSAWQRTQQKCKQLDKFTDAVLSTWWDSHDGLSEDLRFLQPWKVLVQHMLTRIDSQYHVGNISAPDSLLTLESSELRFRIKQDEYGYEKEPGIHRKKSGIADNVLNSAKQAARRLSVLMKSDSIRSALTTLDGR